MKEREKEMLLEVSGALRAAEKNIDRFINSDLADRVALLNAADQLITARLKLSILLNSGPVEQSRSTNGEKR